MPRALRCNEARNKKTAEYTTHLFLISPELILGFLDLLLEVSLLDGELLLVVVSLAQGLKSEHDLK